MGHPEEMFLLQTTYLSMAGKGGTVMEKNPSIKESTLRNDAADEN